MKKRIMQHLGKALLVLLMAPATVQAADSWQEKLLFAPSPSQVKMEVERNRVMIYAGLTDVQVEQAMDRQFDRVEYMMFTGTIVTDDAGEPRRDRSSGELLVEDDGC